MHFGQTALGFSPDRGEFATGSQLGSAAGASSPKALKTGIQGAMRPSTFAQHYQRRGNVDSARFAEELATVERFEPSYSSAWSL
jgi:hypothetical protein